MRNHMFFDMLKLIKEENMRKTTKHAVYTIEEKNTIVKEYLSGLSGYSTLLRKYDISSTSVLNRWIKQYLNNNTTKDNRGKSSNGKGIYGRKKKIIPEKMSREELINYVKATEDIKKLMVFLKQQKKNMK